MALKAQRYEKPQRRSYPIYCLCGKRPQIFQRDTVEPPVIQTILSPLEKETMKLIPMCSILVPYHTARGTRLEAESDWEVLGIIAQT